MKRIIEPSHVGLHQAAAALSPGDISIETLNRTEEKETVAVAPVRQPRKFRPTAFNPDWHDAKEIVVPFDESSFSGLLVDEKTFQSAYSRSLTPPKPHHLRLNTMRTIGKVALTPDWWDDFTAFCSALLIFVEMVLLVWTSALLLSGFPISKWLSYALVAVWPLTLIAFKFVLARPGACRLFLWCGTCSTSLAWLVWSPWSQEFIASFSAYFFRT